MFFCCLETLDIFSSLLSLSYLGFVLVDQELGLIDTPIDLVFSH